MADKDIIIRGAREHNLKDITVQIPRDKFVVITGLSGSGKSSLAFDTLYAEGQRRYVESLSAYARQFLGLMEKPDVDSIDGLSPAISIEQKTTSKNPRSTVGTVTEIYDYLRLLFARIGTLYDLETGEPVIDKTPEQITDHIVELYQGEQITVLAPLVEQKKGTYEQLVKDLHDEGYVRVRIDGTIQRTDEEFTLERYVKHDIEAVQDRVTVSENERSRLAEAVEKATVRSEGAVKILVGDEEFVYRVDESAKLEPRMFSFNSPFGACPTCHGLGIQLQFDEDLVVPDDTLSIVDGAIAPWGKRMDGWRIRQLSAANRKLDLFLPYGQMSKKHRDFIMHGGKDWEGVLPMLARLHKQTESDYRRNQLEGYMIEHPCPTCEGRRLNEKSLAVRIAGKNIIEVTDYSIGEALDFISSLQLTERQQFIAHQIIKEINERLTFLRNVGLDYLNLSRSAGTLSGGEAQRIRLATQIGSNLMGVMYILDEPSIGLHQRDNERLIASLKRLRDVGNTVIVVEHDEDTMKASDWLIDMGPGAGRHGGQIVAEGTPEDVAKGDSETGMYLSGRKQIEVPKKRRAATSHIELKGCSEHNLKDVDATFPVGVLCCITGVSGSGKSTLVNDTLRQALRKKLTKAKVVPGKHTSVEIPEEVTNIITIDQSPIGRTPRSNPATYTKLFDDIRQLFSTTKEAKMRGYQPGRFSFNVRGGRCETCKGDGLIKIEMHFLPDVYVQCEQCKGRRYNKETLQVLYKDKSIADILDMSVEEALEFFSTHTRIKRKLQTLHEVGLDYIKVGQPSTTLSGGEAQRIKLTRELAKRKIGHTVYILDEPTTGLHYEDVRKLLQVLQTLVGKGNTVIVIEHNLDVIKSADWIIDLGPEGGSGGGTIVATGSPEDVSNVKGSHTGRFLKDLLK